MPAPRVTTGTSPESLIHRIALTTLVAAPVLAFRALPTPGILLVGLVLPAAALMPAFLRRRFPAWEVLFLACFALSVLWSVVPDYSAQMLRTFLPLAGATLMAAAVLPRAHVLRALEVSMAIIVVTALVRVISSPGSSFSQGGLSAQFFKNEFGGILTVATLLVVARIHTSPRRGAWWLWTLAVLLPLLALNRSVTAWTVTALLTLTLVVVTGVVRGNGPRRARALLIGAATMGVAATVGLFRVASNPAVLGLVDKDPSLSLRTVIWDASWQWIERSPLLGFGAYGFLDDPSPSPVTRDIWTQFRFYLPPHPHNAVLDVWGQLGVLGLILVLGLLVTRIRSGLGLSLTGDGVALVGVVGLLFIVLFGVTEPTFSKAWSVLMLIFASMTVPRPGETPGAAGDTAYTSLRGSGCRHV